MLAAIRRDDVRASEAGLKYFVLGALSSGMLLYGASLLYGFTGTTSFAGIAAAIPPGGVPSLGIIVGLVFLLAGLAFKVSAVPFHMWSPDVYEGAPTPITAFFAAAAKVAAVALLTRVVIAGFPNAVRAVAADHRLRRHRLDAARRVRGHRPDQHQAADGLFVHRPCGLHAGRPGCRPVPMACAGILIYMAIYLVMTLGVFAVILAMRREDGMVEDIYELAGLAQTNLKMAAVLGVLLFSLAGVPPLAGFFAKWYVFAAAVKAGLYPLAIIGVLASVVSAFYYLRIIKIMFFDEPKPAFAPSDAALAFVMARSVFVHADVRHLAGPLDRMPPTPPPVAQVLTDVTTSATPSSGTRRSAPSGEVGRPMQRRCGCGGGRAGRRCGSRPIVQTGGKGRSGRAWVSRTAAIFSPASLSSTAAPIAAAHQLSLWPASRSSMRWPHAAWTRRAGRCGSSGRTTS